MFRSRQFNISALSLIFMACGADPGTRPHDMSSAQHAAAAEQEQRSADEHAAQHDPQARGTVKRCSKPTVCWTSRANPTKTHEADAQRHRELAAKHRAASASLAQAEARSCAGIEQEDRDISPFYHREDILSVQQLRESDDPGGRYTRETGDPTGARIVIRAVPGLTQEWLQHQVNCHIARAAAAGHDMPEMSYCPLMLKDVKATVSSAGDGFAVDVTSNDKDTVKEILKRAEALAVR